MSAVQSILPTTDVVRGAPQAILRLEGLVLLGAASVAYAQTGIGWGLFALLFLAPDIFMLGYLRNTRIGAMLYNAGHSTIGPFVLIGAGLALASPLTLAIGLIWMAHVGFDRAVGYGLKYADHFKHTHLGTPFASKN